MINEVTYKSRQNENECYEIAKEILTSVKLTVALTLKYVSLLSKLILSGDDGKEVTPVPMPNTEVKLLSADGSRTYVPRVGRCQAI